MSSNTSAYKLIYIKESEMNWFTKEAPTELIPRHLQEKFDREQKAITRIDQLLSKFANQDEILIFTREISKTCDQHGVNMFNYDIYEEEFFNRNQGRRISLRVGK